MFHQWKAWIDCWKPRGYARRPSLVLINGLAEQAESWFRNDWYWRRRFEIHAPNILAYRGAALHRRIEAGLPVSVDFLVEQLHLYLDSFVQAPPYHLVAASLGGKVAIEYAVRYPEEVDRLVLLCPSGLGDEERLPVVEGLRRNDTRGLVASIFHDERHVDERMVDYYVRHFGDRRWRAGLLRTIRGTMDHSVRERLPFVTQPTLLVSGREDKIVDPMHASEAAGLIPDCRHVSIPRCGHAPQMEKAGLVNRLVEEFLLAGQPAARPAPIEACSQGA
ncbi:MAG TPA: alpha/beta fold hydrolase [Gemmataceae bacterium]|nr:alpha/beta fold hydrolase [Gemmataceae bacterium]